jgi:nuclear-control-of-ATPase protein 2
MFHFSTSSVGRRVERLLTSQLHGHHNAQSSSGNISPLATGILLLSVARLRSYAETCLPSRSRLREGFLEDVGDLEDPGLARHEKLRVVDRMWRNWGDVLGWSQMAGGRN